MAILQLLIGDNPKEQKTLLVLAVVLGFSYALAGTVVGDAVSSLPETPDFALFISFLILIVLNLMINGIVVFKIVSRAEDRIADVRQEVLDQIRRLDYPAYERLGRDRLYFNLASNVRRISEATALLGRLLLNVFGAIGCLVMLAVLSVNALVVVVIAISVVGSVYIGNQITIARAQKDAMDHEHLYFSGIENLLNGFKELKLHRRKRDEFFAVEIEEASVNAEEARITAGRHFFLNYILFTLLLLLSAGMVLYVLPLLLPHLADVAVRAAVLAGILPVSVLRDMPAIARAMTAFSELERLKKDLSKESEETLEQVTEPVVRPAKNLSRLTLDQVVYRYTTDDGEHSFTVGPLNMSIQSGQITFLTGGNGSGKSTLVKMLCGLYPVQGGRILVDGEPVSVETLQSLITPIFADLHLFDKLYGYRNVPADVVRDWLTEMGISDKTDYIDGSFTHVKLSSGQRKRLALIGAMIEERPILVLDEWAAEQDPEHRAWYYETFLPRLKTQDRCVLVVSHDEAYFSTADQIVHLENGLVRS